MISLEDAVKKNENIWDKYIRIHTLNGRYYGNIHVAAEYQRRLMGYDKDGERQTQRERIREPDL